MKGISLLKRGGKGRAATVFMQAAALGLILAITAPARAGDTRPIKSRIAPVYPEIAKRMKIAGNVRLEAVVDADGKVKDVKELSGNHMLAVAAEQALRQWKFAPGTGDTSETVEITFTLNQ
jgi:TonB family protein